MHGGVLSHVQAVAVEAVGAYLGQERLHQSTPGVRRTDRIKRVRDERQIAFQLPGRAVTGRIALHPGPHEADF